MQSAFAKKLAESPPKPTSIIVLKPEHFASDYAEAPKSDIAVGVRTLSEKEMQQVAGEAAKEARLYHPDASTIDDGPFTLAYEDAIIKLAVGRCLTNPNDSRDPYFAAADEMVGMAFTAPTIRRVWDELEKTTLANSPIIEAATDDEIADMIELLQAGLVEKLMPAPQLRLRKLLSFVHEELQSIDVALNGADE